MRLIEEVFAIRNESFDSDRFINAIKMHLNKYHEHLQVLKKISSDDAFEIIKKKSIWFQTGFHLLFHV